MAQKGLSPIGSGQFQHQTLLYVDWSYGPTFWSFPRSNLTLDYGVKCGCFYNSFPVDVYELKAIPSRGFDRRPTLALFGLRFYTE